MVEYDCDNTLEHTPAHVCTEEEHTEEKNYYKKDGGFAGITHAVSTLATVLIVAAFFPSVFALAYNFPQAHDNTSYTMSFPMIFLCVVCTVGSCMLPDLDNTKSSAESSLGFVGSILSEVFRAIAVFIQTALRTKRDDATPDPHRGFWHTSMGALLLATPVYLIGSNAKAGDGVDFFNGTLIFTVFVLSYLSICALLHKEFKKKKSKSILFQLFPYIFAALVVAIMYVTQGVEIFSYAFPVAASIFFGMMSHVFGDCHTTSGAPIFAPFTYFTRKKVWWTTRFFSISSGGEFEKNVLVKLYSLAAVIGAFGLVYNYMQ